MSGVRIVNRGAAFARMGKRCVMVCVRLWNRTRTIVELAIVRVVMTMLVSMVIAKMAVIHPRNIVMVLVST